MFRSTCKNCGGCYVWSWDEAFDKFGFGDGDGQVETWRIDRILTRAGYTVYREFWGMHNEIITSIKKNGKELIPYDNPEFQNGYSNPRDFLPKEIIDLLDSA